MMRYCFLVVIVLAGRALGEDEEFLRPMHGMKGLSIKCDTEEKLSLVHSYEGHRNFDFLSITRILGNEIKVLVTADSLRDFETVLARNEIGYTIFIDNVLEEIRKSYVRNENARFAARNRGDTGINKYFPRFNDIEAYLKGLAATYNKTVTLLNIGTSYEGRSIYVLKISSGPGDKPAILIDAGIHAREWIAPVTALHAINQLVANKSNSEFYEKVDWYILPSLNPDGYEFTHTSVDI